MPAVLSLSGEKKPGDNWPEYRVITLVRDNLTGQGFAMSQSARVFGQIRPCQCSLVCNLDKMRLLGSSLKLHTFGGGREWRTSGSYSQAISY